MHVQPKRLCGGIALGVRDRDAAQQIFLLEDFRAGAAGRKSHPTPARSCHRVLVLSD